MANIFLLRHVRTDANLQNRLCGWSDSEPLEAELGKLDSISPPNVDKVFCSPMKRCTCTAESLGYGGIETSESLKEVNFGKWELMTFNEVEKEYPDQARKYLESPLDYTFPEGESLNDLRARIRSFIKEELIGHVTKEKDVLIVGHSGSLRLLLIELLKEDMSLFWKFNIHPGAISSLKYYICDGQTSFVIDSINAKVW